MRELVYYVATTLDGFIARSDGSFDDFPWDDGFIAHLLEVYPETFPASFRGSGHSCADNRRFDAVLMGRKTYEVGQRQGLTSPYPTLDQYLFSRSLKESPDPSVTLVPGDATEKVAELKQESGRAIWICGGSELATGLFEAELVDEVIIKLNPIIFGTGIPLVSRSQTIPPLALVESRTFDSGHVLLTYSVVR